MPKLPLSLCTPDLDMLRESGLTDETIRANNIRTNGDRLAFPYRNLDGTSMNFIRYRLHVPRIANGKPVKYDQPAGSRPRAYFPSASLPLLRDGEGDIYITEGEKKSLALSQLQVAAIGIGGVWCGCEKTGGLIPDLREINWSGRIVYIVFDYDEKPETRMHVANAGRKLGKAILEAGAKDVRIVSLPPGPCGAKQGVDDFLVSSGEFEFAKLVGRATSLVSVVPIVSMPILGEPAYHGLIGDFLRKVAPFTEATDAGVLAHLLAAIGTLIGPGPYISTSGDRQCARVNCLIVGPTSTGRKGTSYAPIKKLMALTNPFFWDEQAVSGLSTGEGLIAKVADKEVWNSETKEREVELVEKRLFVNEPEFSRVLAQSRRDGNILSQVLRESFDSGDLSTLTRSNPLRVKGAHICITGHITPEELRERFDQIEMVNGFGNRFLWFVVKSEKVLPFCNPIPNSACQPLASRLKAIAGYRTVRVALAPEAQSLWRTLYANMREDQPGFAGMLTARSYCFLLRIALIYCLVDPATKILAPIIQPAHINAALAVCQFSEESVKSLFAGRSATGLRGRVLELLAKGPLTKDEFNVHLSVGQKRELSGVLMRLKEENLIRSIERKQATGRPATIWELCN